MNLRSARKIFVRSPATFRPMARWIWNDHPNPERLAAQLDAMLDAGFGGVLIRPGAGLPSGAYLGEEWFEAVAAVAKRARKRRASIWIAEDLDDPETRAVVRGILRDAPDRAARMLVIEDVPPGAAPAATVPGDELVAAFEVTRESARPGRDGAPRTPQALRTLTTGMEDVAPARRLLFRLTTYKDRLSLFDADATLHLIERTHQRYHTQARKYFGNTIGLCLLLGAASPRMTGAVPWDLEAPALFQETHGYSLIANLPALFFDLPGYEVVRFDFWGLLDEMIKEGFTQPFTRWSAERGIPHATMLPGTPGLTEAAPRHGSAMARFSAHTFAVIAPDNGIALHEALSIKRQLSKEGVIEITSAHHPGQRARSAMDRPVHGVNFTAARTVLASLRGERKSAVPSPIVTQDDDTHMRAQLDADARLAWMLGQGSTSAEVLVLHPYTSLKAAYCAGRAAESSGVHAALAHHFEAITQSLDDAGIDFDYGDESVLARHGRAGHRTMRVGQADYRIVVLPPLLNLRSTTLSLLHDFAISGGLLLAVGSLPELVDGRRSNQALTFFEEYGERLLQGPDFGRYQALTDRLTRAKTAVALVEADTGHRPECVAAMQRTWDEIEIAALHNASDRAVRVTLENLTGIGGRAELWDPLDATMQPLGATTPGQPIRQTITVDANASSLVVTVPDEMDSRSLQGTLAEDTRVTPPWTTRRAAPNATALGECRIAESGADGWTEPAQLRRVLAERIAQARGPVSLRTQWRFRVAAGAPSITDCSAVAELSEGASMRLDSDELVTDHDEWILDPSMRVVLLPPLAAGEHTLEIWRLYAAAGDLQAPWLRGPFADVTLKDECTRIAPARDTIALGSLSSQGLRAYVGEIIYAARMDGTAPEGRRVELRLRGLSEPAEVRVDGSRAGFVLPPHTSADLTEFWRSGTRAVEIVLRVPPDGLLAQLRDGRNASPPHHGLPSPPELVTLVRR